MGRFFQTAPTQFVEDYIYQPPWELMDKVAAIKQAEYDSVAQKTDLLNNALLQIKHLNGETDVANVKEIQRYYNDQINQITEHARNNPQDAAALQRNIDKLQKEMLQDFTAGNISKIQGSYNAYEQFRKDNEQLKKDNPSRYTAGEKYYLGQYAEAGGDSIYNQQFKGEAITKDLDWQKILDSIDKLKASSIKRTVATPNGQGYIVEKDGKEEVLTAEELQKFLMAKVLDPTSLASLKQSQQFGLTRYFSDDGQIDLKASGWNPINLTADAASYKQVEDSTKYSNDAAFQAAANRALDESQYQRSQAWEQTKFQIQRQDEAAKAAGADKATRKAPLEAAMAKALIDGDQKAVAIYQSQIDAIDGKSSLTQTNLGSKYADTNALIQASKSGDKIAQKHIDQTLPQTLKEAGINYKDPKQKALAQKVVGMVKQGKLDPNDIPTYIASKNDVNILYQVKSTDIQAEALKMAKERGVKDPTPFYSLAKQKLVLKQTLKDKNSKYGLSSEAAKNIITNGIEKWQTNFANNRGFSSTYEVTGFKPSSQASLASTLNNHEFGEEFSIEIRNKDGKPDIVDYDKSNVKIVAIKGITDKRGNGTNMYVGIDDKGKEYNIIANNENPLTRQFANVAFAGIENKSASVALSLQYPTVGRLRAAIEGSKRLNTKDLNFDIAIGNKNYRIKVDTNNNVQAYDEYAKPVFSLPKDYIEAGIALENLNK